LQVFLTRRLSGVTEDRPPAHHVLPDCRIDMKTVFIIAKFLISKDDLYSIKVVTAFDDIRAADDYFNAHGFSDKSGGTWQERCEYHVVEVRDGLYYQPGGGRIGTVLDRR
jgi:hypothetical protein